MRPRQIAVALVTLLIAFVVTLVAGYGYGYRAGVKKFDNLVDEISKAATKTETIQQVIMPTVHTERIEYRDRIKRIDVEVPKIVEREVYKNVCLDEDGLKAFNTYFGAK